MPNIDKSQIMVRHMFYTLIALAISLVLVSCGGSGSQESTSKTTTEKISGTWVLATRDGQQSLDSGQEYLEINNRSVRHVWYATDNPECWTYGNVREILSVSSDTVALEDGISPEVLTVEFEGDDMIWTFIEGGDSWSVGSEYRYVPSSQDVAELSPRCSEV